MPPTSFVAVAGDGARAACACHLLTRVAREGRHRATVPSCTRRPPVFTRTVVLPLSTRACAAGDSTRTTTTTLPGTLLPMLPVSPYATEEDTFTPCGVVPDCDRPLDVVLAIDVSDSQYNRHIISDAAGGGCTGRMAQLTHSHYVLSYARKMMQVFAPRMKPAWTGPAKKGVRVAVVLFAWEARVAIPFTYASDRARVRPLPLHAHAAHRTNWARGGPADMHAWHCAHRSKACAPDNGRGSGPNAQWPLHTHACASAVVLVGPALGGRARVRPATAAVHAS